MPDPNPTYVKAMQGHAKLLAAFPASLKMALLEELENDAALHGDLDAAIDGLRQLVWDDRFAALMYSSTIVALGSDLEAMRQKGDIKDHPMPAFEELGPPQRDDGLDDFDADEDDGEFYDDEEEEW